MIHTGKIYDHVKYTVVYTILTDGDRLYMIVYSLKIVFHQKNDRIVPKLEDRLLYTVYMYLSYSCNS